MVKQPQRQLFQHMNAIAELNSLELIEEIINEYKNSFGAEPFNLSHWDPAPSFIDRVLSSLDICYPDRVIEYSFSYEFPFKRQLIQRLGFAQDKSVLITPSGSTSIMCVSNWLNYMGVKTAAILCPVYFSAPHSMNKFGIKTDNIYIHRKNGQFLFPEDAIDRAIKAKALWITNPIYCTGVGYTENQINLIGSILDSGCIVVADECLTMSGDELGRILGGHKNFIGIYAPHKSICVNGVKFSAIVHHGDFEHHFDQWADVIYGSIGLSSVSAVHHYLSKNFHEYESLLIKETNLSASFIRKVAEKYNNIELDYSQKGYLSTIYFPRLSGEYGNDKSFLENLTKTTATAVIPGARNHFHNSIGFCFRVNLARNSPQFKASIIRLLQFLSNMPN